MPNPQFTKPWHGIPRENIKWNPTVIEDACIGCGTCVTGCSRLVYRFDFDRKKPVVVDPLNCMVGCTTCANICPANAIAFPPIETILALEGKAEVRHAVEDDLIARKEILKSNTTVPHPDRIIQLVVTHIENPIPNILRMTLSPVTSGECFCEFVPGQYIELWRPESSYLSRSYSIANAPHGDGRIELHIRRVDGGRFSSWAFDEMKIGDRLQARGPVGGFTMRSLPDMPLLFIAGGTGIAPILALLEQQVGFAPNRDMILIWGMRNAADFYAIDILEGFIQRAPNLNIVLFAEAGANQDSSASRIIFKRGTPVDAIKLEPKSLSDRDIYVAGPPVMLREVAHALKAVGTDEKRVHIDSFGV